MQYTSQIINNQGQSGIRRVRAPQSVSVMNIATTNFSCNHAKGKDGHKIPTADVDEIVNIKKRHTYTLGKMPVKG